MVRHGAQGMARSLKALAESQRLTSAYDASTEPGMYGPRQPASH